MKKIELGDLVIDKVTHFKGIVTQKIYYLYDCTNFCVTPQGLTAEGKIKESYYIEEPRLNIVEKETISVNSKISPDTSTKESSKSEKAKNKKEVEVEVTIKPTPVAVNTMKTVEPIAEEEDVSVITYNDFQELAKIKMKLPNVNRNDIKKIVNDIKKDAQISDLSAKELALGYENMKLLK